MTNPFGDKNSTYFRYQSRDKAFEKKDNDKKDKSKTSRYLNASLKITLYVFIVVISFVLFAINAIMYNAKTDVQDSVAQFNAETISVYNSLDNQDLVSTLEREAEEKEDKYDSAVSSFVILQMKTIIDEEYIAGRVGVKENMSTTQAIENVAPYFAVCDSIKSVDTSLPNMQDIRAVCGSYEDSANNMMDSIVRYNYFSQESIIGSLAFGNNVKYPDIKSANIDDVGIFSDRINAK